MGRIFISGLHSSANPLSGVGVARSLKAEMPSCELIGVDYSSLSTGLAWDGFSQVVVRPAWNEDSPHQHSKFVAEMLSDGGFWLSCLDLEIDLLAKNLVNPKILSPGLLSALAITSKPCDKAAGILGLARPRTCTVKCAPQKLFDFLCSTGWQAWLKPSHYGAFPVRSWPEYTSSLQMLRSIWGQAEAFVEEHIPGKFEYIAFASFDGNYLGGIAMHKGEITSEGKTWTGRIEELSKSTEETISGFCKELEWTGGAELECIRHPDGLLYLLEVNPRFPAWIYGATISGTNLPARLVKAAQGEIIADLSTKGGGVNEFVRLVLEYPKKTVSESDIPVDSQVHPSGMPLLSRASNQDLASLDFGSMLQPDDIKIREMIAAFKAHGGAQSGVVTPYYCLDEPGLQRRLQEFNEVLRANGTNNHNVKFAYSCKTNPRLDILDAACRAGWLAETISMLEVEVCVSAGFDTNKLILNGPAKLWPKSCFEKYKKQSFYAINCDSYTELDVS